MSLVATRLLAITQVGMWVFVISDAVGFAALFATAASLRTDQESFWPAHGGPALTVGLAGTALLAVVSASLVLARVAERARRSRAVRALAAAAALAATAFVGLQALEYSELALTWRLGSAGVESFVAVTGYHLAHVLFGAAALWRWCLRPSESLAALSIYWHFVDGLWIAILLFFYLF